MGDNVDAVSQSGEVPSSDGLDLHRPGSATAKRITVNLRSQDVARLQELMERTELKLNDVIRRAISTEEFIQEQLASGRRVLVEEQDGTMHIVDFVG